MLCDGWEGADVDVGSTPVFTPVNMDWRIGRKWPKNKAERLVRVASPAWVARHSRRFAIRVRRRRKRNSGSSFNSLNRHHLLPQPHRGGGLEADDKAKRTNMIGQNSRERNGWGRRSRKDWTQNSLWSRDRAPDSWRTMGGGHCYDTVSPRTHCFVYVPAFD